MGVCLGDLPNNIKWSNTRMYTWNWKEIKRWAIFKEKWESWNKQTNKKLKSWCSRLQQIIIKRSAFLKETWHKWWLQTLKHFYVNKTTKNYSWNLFCRFLSNKPIKPPLELKRNNKQNKTNKKYLISHCHKIQSHLRGFRKTPVT